MSLFLIVSSYGLTKSFLNTNSLDNFLLKRINKVYIPYLIVTLSWFTIDYLFLSKTYSLDIIITSLIGLNIDIYNGVDQSLWFIPYIIFWYLCFYIVFNLQLDLSKRIILLFFIGVLIQFIPIDTQFFHLAKLYSFAFPLGAWYACIKITDYNQRFISLTAFILFLIFIIKQPEDYSLYRNMAATISFDLFFISLIVFTRLGSKFKFLEFIGLISYEIYLFEMVFLDKYKILYIFESKLISIFLYFMVVLMLSVLLNYFLKNRLVFELCQNNHEYKIYHR